MFASIFECIAPYLPPNIFEWKVEKGFLLDYNLITVWYEVMGQFFSRSKTLLFK